MARARIESRGFVVALTLAGSLFCVIVFLCAFEFDPVRKSKVSGALTFRDGVRVRTSIRPSVIILEKASRLVFFGSPRNEGFKFNTLLCIFRCGDRILPLVVEVLPEDYEEKSDE